VGLLVIIGIALVVATAACAVVEAMAQARGRDARAWTVAAFIGLLFALVGYVAVVVALLVLGPSHDRGLQQPVTTSLHPRAPHP
jgi:hypothetical protein